MNCQAVAEAEKNMVFAARLTQQGHKIASMDDLMELYEKSFSVQTVAAMGALPHPTIQKFAVITVAIVGASRRFLAQITRHRIASYSVQSQRYVRLDEFEYVTPPEIEADPAALDAFRQAMDQQGEEYRRIAALLKDGHIRRLMQQGMSEKEATRKAEKLAIEDARFVLPNACDTKMIVTMNARSLHNFFKHRCCARAQWEIRALADEMLRLVYPIAPALFAMAGPSCVRGACSEGSMTCGEAAAMQEKYAKLKEEAQGQ